MTTANKIILILDKLEDALLVLILSAMILLAIFQIISRNLFAEGAVWIDPLLRMLVLWVGLAGAVVATRKNNHIRIDIFTKYLPEKFLPYVERLVYLFTLSVCILIGWHASRFVYSEYEYGTVAFGVVPTWVGTMIIPVSFTLIALRYLLLMIHPGSRKSDNGVGT